MFKKKFRLLNQNSIQTPILLKYEPVGKRRPYLVLVTPTFVRAGYFQIISWLLAKPCPDTISLKAEAHTKEHT